MVSIPIVLTPLHYVYLAGVISILAVMAFKKDTPAVCIAFLFLAGVTRSRSFSQGIMTVFRGMLYAAREFMEVIAVISLVTALSLCLKELGSHRIMMVPMSRVMKTPTSAWWILGLSMLLFSLFLWPSPSAALIGAIMLPFALKAGLHPLMAAMAMNLFGHGMALSFDFIIQGAPGISAAAAGIPPAQILLKGAPVFLSMWAATATGAFFLNRREIVGGVGRRDSISAPVSSMSAAKSTPALILAWLTPAVFLGDIVLLLTLRLSGGEATSLVGGTAILLTCLGAVLGFKGNFCEKVTDYLTEGFLFAMKIFAPVMAIGAFFFLGGGGISQILGKPFESGILNDWALWLSAHMPVTKPAAAALLMLVGAITGLDGSGFSGLPLTGALARTFGETSGGSIAILAALGQICAVFTGGGTIIPWGLIPVAAICHVDPMALARKNLCPVLIGFLAAFLAACILL